MHKELQQENINRQKEMQQNLRNTLLKQIQLKRFNLIEEVTQIPSNLFYNNYLSKIKYLFLESNETNRKLEEKYT